MTPSTLEAVRAIYEIIGAVSFWFGFLFGFAFWVWFFRSMSGK